MPGKQGYFPADSMAVRVMSKRAVGLTYGERALVVGATNPLLYVGTAENTSHRETPYNRLALTGRLFEAVFLGSKDEADRALEFTRKKHERVVGGLPEAAGPHHPAGARYSARDPHLMYMTMAFTFDSAEAMHDLLVRTLTDGEREGLWQDFVRWAELFGMPRSAAPGTYREFRASFDSYLASDQLFLTAEARLVGAHLAGAEKQKYPLPGRLRHGAPALALIVQGSLPSRIREIYGLRWSSANELAFQVAVRAMRAVHFRPRLAPAGPLRIALRGPSAPSYATLARGERELIRSGRPSMPGVDTTRRAQETA